MPTNPPEKAKASPHLRLSLRASVTYFRRRTKTMPTPETKPVTWATVATSRIWTRRSATGAKTNPMQTLAAGIIIRMFVIPCIHLASTYNLLSLYYHYAHVRPPLLYTLLCRTAVYIRVFIISVHIAQFTLALLKQPIAVLSILILSLYSTDKHGYVDTH